MPGDLAGVFYVAELDAGIAEDFDEFSDRGYRDRRRYYRR